MIKNYAHRGFSSKYPENTLLAFQKALEEGVDGIELDIQLTRDGQIIILHDEKLDRTTNGSGWLKDRTLEEIRQLDAGASFGGRFGPQRIPTLREYLDLVKDEPILTNIEMKTATVWYPRIGKKLVELLREYRITDRILISSFNHFTILHMRMFAPELRYAFLTSKRRCLSGKLLHRCGIPCYHPSYLTLTPETIADLHSHGIEINPYTVDDPDAIRDMIRKGIDGVITDCPDVVNRIRRET